jgi:hypothetical protein
VTERGRKKQGEIPAEICGEARSEHGGTEVPDIPAICLPLEEKMGWQYRILI